MGVRRDGKGGVGEGGTGLGQSGGGGNAGTVVGLATRRRILAAAAMVQTSTQKNDKTNKVAQPKFRSKIAPTTGQS